MVSEGLRWETLRPEAAVKKTRSGCLGALKGPSCLLFSHPQPRSAIPGAALAVGRRAPSQQLPAYEIEKCSLACSWLQQVKENIADITNQMSV